MKFIHSISKSPEKFFLFASLTFGLLFLFLTPPFQVPDEPNHFYKAWQISKGIFISDKTDQRVGGMLPSSLETIRVPFEAIMWNPGARFRDADILNVLNTPIGGHNKFFDFNNTALYSPICYLPQAIGILPFRLLEAPPLYAFYGGRVMTLLTWIFIVFVSIKIMPYCKWLFCLLALMPMSVFINMSLSADVMTNALCFLFIAFVIHLVFIDQLISARLLMILVFSVVSVSLIKSVYAPIILLIFIIPKTKFRNTKDYYLKTGGVLLIGLFVAFTWSRVIGKLYIPYDLYNEDFRKTATVAPGANMYTQLEYLREVPSRVFTILRNSVLDCSLSHMEGYIGLFGWLDTKLPQWMIYSAYCLVIAISLFETRIIELRKRIFIFFIFFFILLLVFLSQYLTWLVIGAPSVSYIQGRYLIPFYPLFFIGISGLFPKQKLVPPLVITGALFLLSYSLFVLYLRYVP